MDEILSIAFTLIKTVTAQRREYIKNYSNHCTFELYVLFLPLISHSGHKQLNNLLRENRKFYVLHSLLKESTLVYEYN